MRELYACDSLRRYSLHHCSKSTVLVSTPSDSIARCREGDVSAGMRSRLEKPRDARLRGGSPGGGSSRPALARP